MSIINYFNESEIMNQHRYGNGTDTNHKWPAAKNCVWWWVWQFYANHGENK
jgi:hypothetical protein